MINDSAIMVDFFNKNFVNKVKDESGSIIDKIVVGVKQLFRLVALTTLTTVVALLPTVYGICGDAKMLVPAVLAMANGLLFTTLITLFFIHCLYLVNNDIRIFFSASWNRIKSLGSNMPSSGMSKRS